MMEVEISAPNLYDPVDVRQLEIDGLSASIGEGSATVDLVTFRDVHFSKSIYTVGYDLIFSSALPLCTCVFWYPYGFEFLPK
jgi:hypothetical protein